MQRGAGARINSHTRLQAKLVTLGALGCKPLAGLAQQKARRDTPSRSAAPPQSSAGPESLRPEHRWDGVRSAAIKEPIFSLSNWNNWAVGLERRLGRAEV